MKLKFILTFLIIIMLLSIFSSRLLNYDDLHYITQSKLIEEYGHNEAFNREVNFLGKTYTSNDGTHSKLPAYFYLILRKALSHYSFFHLIIYILYATMIFPVYFIFKKYNNKYHFLKTLLFISMPALVLNANSLMTDIPGLILFIWALYFYKCRKDKISFIISILLFITSMLMSYIYGYFLIILFIDLIFQKKKNIKSFLSIILFTLIILIVLILTGNVVSPFTALRWPGSETIFNYHKTGMKFLSLFMLIGFFTLFNLFNKNTYKNPFFYVALFLGIVFYYSYSGYPLTTMLIFIILTGNGVFTAINVFMKESEFPFIYTIYGVFAIVSVAFFPMIISRYLLIIILPIVIIVASEMKRKYLYIGIVFNIVLSVLLLYSDMVFTNSLYDININNNNKPLYYIGEWAFRVRMEEINGKMLLSSETELEDSSIIVIPDGMAAWEINEHIKPHLHHISTDSINSPLLSTYSKKGRCGLYADEYGCLPFSIVRGDVFTYRTYIYLTHIPELMNDNKNKIEIWDRDPIIPLTVPDTIVFKNVENTLFDFQFFPDNRVRDISDGIGVYFIHNEYVINYSIIKPLIENNVIIMGKYDSLIIITDTLNNSLYDWVGVNAKQKD